MILFAKTHSFRTLFFWMVVVFVGAGILEGYGFGDELLFIVMSLVLLSAMRAVQERHIQAVFVVCAALTVISNLAAYFSSAKWIDAATLALNLGIFGYTTWLTFLKVFSGRKVDADTIFGAVCVYVLLGMVWAVAYQLISVTNASAFAITFEGAPAISSVVDDFLRTYIYYSFTTLTSTGFGDIVPVSPLARYASVLEAICGQIYLTVLVARVVGLHISSYK